MLKNSKRSCNDSRRRADETNEGDLKAVRLYEIFFIKISKLLFVRFYNSPRVELKF